jgi:hypothetical protein
MKPSRTFTGGSQSAEATVGKKLSINEARVEAAALLLEQCDDPKKLAKIQKLAVAAALAPKVRVGGGRKIFVEGKDGAYCEIDAAELLRILVARTGVEIAAQPGKRPERIICKCGTVVPVGRGGGPVPTCCRTCYGRARRAQNIEKERARERAKARAYRENNAEKARACVRRAHQKKVQQEASSG